MGVKMSFTLQRALEYTILIQANAGFQILNMVFLEEQKIPRRCKSADTKSGQVTFHEYYPGTKRTKNFNSKVIISPKLCYCSN